MAQRLILVVLLACLAGCGGGGGDEGGPVRFLVFGEPEELKAYRAVFADYSEELTD